MKTPILRIYEEKIAQVNDQLCYFLFTDIELENALTGITKGHEDKLTTELFPDNKFSPRLRVYIKALHSFRDNAFHTLMGVNIIAAVEYMLCYINDIEGYRAAVLPTPFDSKTSDKPEEQLQEKLKGWLGKQPDSSIIKTINYLRLRRNHLAHLSDKMSNDFSSLVKNDANCLNKYWGEKKTNIYDFDFSNRDCSTFKENEALALINLIFVCIKIVDEMVLSSISMTDIAKYEIVEFLQNKLINGRSLLSRRSKFRGVLLAKYGVPFELTENDFLNHEKGAQPGAQH